MKIAFFDAKPYEKIFFNDGNSTFGFDIEYFESRLTLNSSYLAKGYDVVCIFVNDEITKDIIDDLYKLGVGLIALRCAGYNNVDIKSANKKIKIVRVPHYSPHAVAEYSVGMMLCLNRKIHHAYIRTKENNFGIDNLIGFDMYGKTVGIIGCGQIGSAVAKILNGFGMRVLCYDIDKLFVEKSECLYANLSTIYKESDIITLHCQSTAENLHMIDSNAIAQMKDNVMLINTGRGALIDTAALIVALKSKKIGYAGLDVYEEEGKYFYEDLSSSFILDDVLARLQTFPNVLITSHQAFFTKEAMCNIVNATLENIKAYSDGKPLTNEVIAN